MMGETVLIVEDEIFVAMDIERVLADAGYRVIGIAADRNEACNLDTPPTIAFVDINLRDGPTGPQIACDLAANYGTKVVYVTANPGQIVPRAPTALGFIRKPFDDAAIRDAAALAAVGSAGAVGTSSLTLF